MNPMLLLLQDNQSTIKMIQSGRSNSEKSRHIDIRFYFVCDRVKNKEVIVKYMNTKEMTADLLTKPSKVGSSKTCVSCLWGSCERRQRVNNYGGVMK